MSHQRTANAAASNCSHIIQGLGCLLLANDDMWGGFDRVEEDVNR